MLVPIQYLHKPKSNGCQVKEDILQFEVIIFYKGSVLYCIIALFVANTNLLLQN
jgi:hypothetical protein